MTIMSDYFQRVVTLTPDTYFSVHRIKPGTSKSSSAPGIAYQDFDLAEKTVRRWVGQGFNVYLAMGAQEKCEPDGTAIRRKNNTVAARCLYMDIDVKPETYATKQEAVDAFKAFLKQANLPLPTVIVSSGSGGFHVYWTLSELITPDEHKKLSGQLSLAAKSFGLKFDSGCTTDLVRLFRVPETFNFNYNSALPVKLLPPNGEVDINTMRRILDRYAFITPKSSTRTTSVNDDLRGGATYRLPLIDQVAELCPYIKETLVKGGSNLENEPQWHDMAALACHCVDPSATVHRLCKGSQYYNPIDTEKKLEEAQEYRSQDPTLGPPKCATLRGNGAPHCDTCLYLAENTTPLSLPFRINGYPSIVNDLPPGYFRDDRDRICLEEKEEKSDKPEHIIVFPYPLYPSSGHLEDGKPDRLTFMTLIGEQKTEVSFETSVFAENTRFHSAFLGVCLPFPYHLSKARAFFVSYIQLLQSKKETMIRVPPLGWEQQAGIWGFAYGGEFVTPQGKFPCHHPGRGIEDYKVVGNDIAWRAMAQMVLTKDRPDLMVLVASAFSAPLVQMTGQNGYLLGTYSAASGIGKTTSLLLAQSVWARPVLGGFSDTVNYTFSKCATLRNLPVIYDEIKGDQQVGDFVKIVFAMTGGREKGRSDRSGHMRKTDTWQTNICYATNESIVSAVADQTQGTHASVYRVFEFEAINKHYPLTSTIAGLVTQLNSNYGSIGKAYAEYLGEHYEDINKMLLKFQTKLEQDLFAQSAERCWIAAISTTLYGAFLAKSLGLAPFDIPLMKEFMLDQFNRMRYDQKLSDGDYTNPNALYHELNRFMNESGPSTIVTDRAWTTKGKPSANYARIIRHPQAGQTIGIQISGNPLTIRIREAFFGEWCKKYKRSKPTIIRGLEKLGVVTKHRARLASGTSMATSEEWIFVIPVTGTPLEDQCEYEIQYKVDP